MNRTVNNHTGLATFSPNGHVLAWHDNSNALAFHRGPNNERIISAERPDHSQVAVFPGGGGWVGRTYSYRGVNYSRRTFSSQGVTYDRYYSQYPFHNITLSVYAPVRYYPAPYYVWAYRPWNRRISYGWGWRNDPWYGTYGAAFQPYGYYGGASPWLTDYMLADSMGIAYQQRFGGNGSGAPTSPDPQHSSTGAFADTGGSSPITPIPENVKSDISGEVQRQTEALQHDGNQSGDPSSRNVVDVLADNQSHTFVAGTELIVVDNSGAECALTAGDSVQFVPPPPSGADTVAVEVHVLWGKGNHDCQAGSVVTVAMQDLQEMENYMLATVDRGLDRLQVEQAQGKVPRAPINSNNPTLQPFPGGAPPADKNIQAQLDQQSLETDKTELALAKP